MGLADAETNINPKAFTGAEPHTYQGNLWHLHPAIVKRLVPLANFVNWRWELNGKGDAWTKVPYQPRDPTKRAATNDKRTWGTHADAVANVEAGRATGIGFCLLETNLCAFDIDDCRDLATGNIDPVATQLIARCGATYVEVTVSGGGLRIIGLGGTKYVNRKHKILGSRVSIESYRNCARYITISGMTFDGVEPSLPDLSDIDQVITEVVDELDQGNSTSNFNTTNNNAQIDDDNGDVNPFLELSLPPDLMQLVRDGVPKGDRSDQFFHAVKWLKELKWSLGDIIALLRKHPNGIANKYAAGNRVAAEARRAYGKPDSHKPDDTPTQQAKGAPKLLLSSEEFTRNFVPPDYLWDGILLRGFVYSFTAKTGDGKTAIALSLTAAIARGKDFAGHEVAPGTVLYFAGENPDDVRMRWIAMAEHFNFDADTIGVHFISGTFDIQKLEAKIRQEVAAIGGVVLVVIDTSPAYFQGENENDNVEMIEHAQMLSRLKHLPGGPTVIAACHPVKSAGNDNLIPRGGGGFLNAMDGNLCAYKTDMLVTVNWQGKFRGVDFEPMKFELAPVTARKLLDSKGRHIPTVIAKDLSKADQRQKADELRNQEDDILILLLDRTVSTSYTDIADALHWYTGKDSHPNKSKVQRLMKDLTSGGAKNKLIEVDRDGAKLTTKGKAAAKAAEYNRDAAGATYG